MFQLKDESIPFVEFAQVGSIGTLLIKDFGDVGGLDFAGVAAHRDAFVIDFLLEHPGREEHVERGINKLVSIPLLMLRIEFLQFHLNLNISFGPIIGIKRPATAYFNTHNKNHLFFVDLLEC